MPEEMPDEIEQLLIELNGHIRAIEFAQREIDNGAEAIMFRNIPNSRNDECNPRGNGSCPIEVTALRRCQKQIFLG